MRRGDTGESGEETPDVPAAIGDTDSPGPAPSQPRPRWLRGWLIAALAWAVVATVVAVSLVAWRAGQGDEIERLRADLATQRGRLEVKEERLNEAEDEAARLAAEMEECRQASEASQRALGLWQDLVGASAEGQELRTLRAFFRLQDYRREWRRTAKACLGEGAEVF